jgi:hypothetical protein
VASSRKQIPSSNTINAPKPLYKNIITTQNIFPKLSVFLFLPNRKSHQFLGARVNLKHGVEVAVIGKMGNRLTLGGWVMRLTRLDLYSLVIYPDD